MIVLTVAVALVAALGLLNLLLVLAVVRRLREHDERLVTLTSALPDIDVSRHVGRDLPEFTATAIDGVVVDDTTVRGERWVVGFFSVGCEPCHEQAPTFAALAGRTLAVVVGDPEGDDLLARLRGAGRVVAERPGAGLAHMLGIRSFPTLLVFGPDGAVTHAANAIADLSAGHDDAAPIGAAASSRRVRA